MLFPLAPPLLFELPQLLPLIQAMATVYDHGAP
jgi:hypothetical protein